MSAHTPGPWTIEGYGSECEVLGPEGQLIADVFSHGAENANARLIAVAPELLAACKALQMEAAARNCGLRIADEAIAKAEGIGKDGK